MMRGCLRSSPRATTDRGFSGVSLTFARHARRGHARRPRGSRRRGARRTVRPGGDLPHRARASGRARCAWPRTSAWIERPSIELGIDPYAELSVVDYGDADAPASDVLAAHASIQARVGEILAAGAIPAVIGGDHSITLPDPAGARRAPRRRRLQRHPLRHARRHGRGRVRRPAARPRAAVLARGRRGRPARRQHHRRSACAAAGRSRPTSTACAARASAGTRWARSTSAACAPCSTRRSRTPASALRAPT